MNLKDALMTGEEDLKFEQSIKMPKSVTLWQLDKKNMVLTLRIPPFYEVDLEWMKTSAEILDWVAQVNAKSWATVEIIGQLFKAIDHILQFQANYCSGGKERAPLKLQDNKWAMEVL